MRVLRRIRRIARILTGREIFLSRDVRVDHEHLGSRYGGWSVHLAGLNAESVIYSAGIGEDISFDLAVHAKTGAVIVAVDPVPRAAEWVKTRARPEQLQLVRVALGGADATMSLWPPEDPSHVSFSMYKRPKAPESPLEVPVRRLGTLAKELGHDRIHLLKMDIEGAEYDVLGDMLDHGPLPDQLLVEFHHRFVPDGGSKTRDLLRRLRRSGYRLFAWTRDAEECCFLLDSAARPASDRDSRS